MKGAHLQSLPQLICDINWVKLSFREILAVYQICQRVRGKILLKVSTLPFVNARGVDQTMDAIL